MRLERDYYRKFNRDVKLALQWAEGTFDGEMIESRTYTKKYIAFEGEGVNYIESIAKIINVYLEPRGYVALTHYEKIFKPVKFW